MRNIRPVLKSLAAAVLLLVGLLAIIYCAAERFVHPDLTETQLLLAYWPFYLVGAVGLVWGSGLMPGGRWNRQ